MIEHQRTIDTPSGPRTSYFTEWGDSNSKKTVVCVHGLTRNCRDFDYLATVLAKDFRVICPDIMGRGRSDWLEDSSQYTYELYLQQIRSLCRSEQLDEVYWVGTSMGGILGLLLASTAESFISKLVLNDLGIFIPKESLDRIAISISNPPSFSSLKEMKNHLRESMASFGEMSDEQWQHLSQTGSYLGADGRYRRNYDPRIASALQGTNEDVDLNEPWQQVNCPTLIMRGADSDVLLAETANKMATKPNTELVEFPRVGHAPMLINDDQTTTILNFLLR